MVEYCWCGGFLELIGLFYVRSGNFLWGCEKYTKNNTGVLFCLKYNSIIGHIRQGPTAWLKRGGGLSVGGKKSEIGVYRNWEVRLNYTLCTMNEECFWSIFAIGQ